MNRTTKVLWSIRIVLVSLCVYFLISSVYHFGEHKYWSGKLEGYDQGIGDGRKLGYYEDYLWVLEQGREWGYIECYNAIMWWESQSLISLTVGEDRNG